MSRRMTAPGIWTLEEPSQASIHAKAFAVSAETVGHMRPVLTYSQPQMHPGYKPKAVKP